MEEKGKTITRFLDTLYKYKLFVYIGGTLLLGIVAIILVYSIPYSKYKKVYFETAVTENTTYVKKFKKIDSLKEFKLNIKWDTYTKPKENSSNELSGGQYSFVFDYENTSGVVINSVQITPVLQTNWTDCRGIGSEVSISLTNSTTATVPFNYLLPKNPLWFVKVTDPILYLKIVVSKPGVGTNYVVTETYYVRYSLNKLNPHKPPLE